MTDLELYGLLVGALLPALVAVIQQPRWPSWFRAVVSVASSIVAGSLTVYLTEGDALWEQGHLHVVLLVGVASWASYQSFWRSTGVAPVIEAKTSVAPSE